MIANLAKRCERHPDPFDCPDSVVVEMGTTRIGLPVHDGGSSAVLINFCPWCGTPIAP